MAKRISLEEYPDIVRENPKDFVRVGNGVIAHTQTHNGLNFRGALEAVAQEGVKISPIPVFMNYRGDVFAASRGEGKLVYADGSPVDRNRAKDFWKGLSGKYANGVYVWLNAGFSKDDDGTWHIHEDFHIEDDFFGIRHVAERKPLLQKCVMEDGFVSLELNEQGTPTRMSRVAGYQPHTNIHYSAPRNGSVAGFIADSGGAGLNCGWIPSNSYLSLGVLAYARKISE